MSDQQHEHDALYDFQPDNRTVSLTVALVIVELLGVLCTMSEGFWFEVAAPILIFNVGPLLCLLIFVRCMRC